MKFRTIKCLIPFLFKVYVVPQHETDEISLSPWKRTAYVPRVDSSSSDDSEAELDNVQLAEKGYIFQTCFRRVTQRIDDFNLRLRNSYACFKTLVQVELPY